MPIEEEEEELTVNLSKEQNMLPEDDLRSEICRSILSVLMYKNLRIIILLQYICWCVINNGYKCCVFSLTVSVQENIIHLIAVLNMSFL